MCLAIPLKIIKIENNKAIVDSGDHHHKVDLSLVKNAKVGEYLIIKDNLAINKLKKQEAEKIIKIVSGLTNLGH